MSPSDWIIVVAFWTMMCFIGWRSRPSPLDQGAPPQVEHTPATRQHSRSHAAWVGTVVGATSGAMMAFVVEAVPREPLVILASSGFYGGVGAAIAWCASVLQD